MLTACSAIFVKVAAVPGPTAAFYRVLFAGALAVPWALSRRPPTPATPVLGLAAVSGLCFAATAALWNSALLVTTAANATLLLQLAPVWIGLAALFFGRERLGPVFWVGLATALAGMALVVAGGARQLTRVNAGDALAVGSSVSYAVYLVSTRRARATLDAPTLFALSTASSIVVLLVACAALGSPLGGFSGRTWAALAASGLVSHFAGYLAISYALGHLQASSVSVSLLSQPVVTALLAASMLDEPLGGVQVAGGALVLAGVYAVNRRESPNAPPKEALPEASATGPTTERRGR